MRRLFNRFKIRTRITVAIMIPVLGLLVFASMQTFSAMGQSSRMGKLQSLADVAPVISEVVHELQKERGMSAGFIGSGGAKFADSLPDQRGATDLKTQKLDETLAAFDRSAYGAEISERLDAALGRLEGLGATRGGVADLSLTVPKMAGYYTGTIADLLGVVEAMKRLSDNAEVLSSIAAYSAFLQAKERAGQERAMGAGGFGAGAFAAPVYRRFLQLIAMQDVFLHTMSSHASAEELRFMEQTLAGPVVEEVERMREIAIQSPETGSTGGIEAPRWFEAITQKINLMKTVEDHLAADLLTKVATLRSDAQSAFTLLGIVVAALLAVTALLCTVIVRGITGPLAQVTEAVTELARGETEIEIDTEERADEVGDIQRAVVVFRDNVIEMSKMREEQAEAQERAEAEKKKAVNDLADGFESSVKVVVDAVASASSEVKAMAESVAGTADDTKNRSASVVTAAEQASGNVQTVATAAEQLNASVTEIGRQVSRASEIAAEGARQAERTDSDVAGLVEAAQKIGEVVSLIADIAEQTNLLALNATIEAARAGEAGKGFAVVASEVKSLATQTAKATDDISQQVASIQDATSGAAEAIRAIGGTVNEINEIATAIASAMEEQGAATQEIARNVQEAAHGTQEVTTNINQVTASADEAGQSAGTMVEAANDLARQAETLSSEVDGFVGKVRAA